MTSILRFELKKLRHDLFILIAYLLAIAVPIIMTAITYWQTVTRGSYVDTNPMSFIGANQMLCQVGVFPVFSGFIITFMMQKEYADRTLLNILTAPVARSKYIASKIFIWLGWTAVLTISFYGVMMFAVFIISGPAYCSQLWMEILSRIAKSACLSSISLFPILTVAVLQREKYFPSILVTLGVVLLGLMGLYMSEKMGSIVPWAAIEKMMLLPGSVNETTAYASIFITGLIGILSSLVLFKKQEL